MDICIGASCVRIRLCGIDAPERGEVGYREATDALRSLISRETVRCVRVAPYAGQHRKGPTVAQGECCRASLNSENAMGDEHGGDRIARREWRAKRKDWLWLMGRAHHGSARFSASTMGRCIASPCPAPPLSRPAWQSPAALRASGSDQRRSRPRDGLRRAPCATAEQRHQVIGIPDDLLTFLASAPPSEHVHRPYPIVVPRSHLIGSQGWGEGTVGRRLTIQSGARSDISTIVTSGVTLIGWAFRRL